MKRNNRIGAIVVSALLITSICNSVPALADPNDSNLTLEQAIQNIQEYDNEIEYNMGKLNQLKEQILEKENDIKDNQVKLDLTQTQFTERENQLSERLKGIQFNGGFEATPLQYLDALFSSGDILDALKRVSLISQICTSDKDLILETKKSEDNLLNIKTTIEKENQELQTDKDDVEKQIKDLEDKKDTLLKYVQDNNALLTGDIGITIPVTLPSDITESG